MVAKFSVGNKEASETALIELKEFVNAIDVYELRLEVILQKITNTLKTVLYLDKIVSNKRIGMLSVSRFVADIGDISR
ncbi:MULTISPECIES: hypothetical protein [Clostridia]|jgi:PIN domain nuclease of toxin-antitoxin system|uniref:hypothetical protein n=1 Tax=Clostridia TaxID=186801 RepID=UPI001485CB52|nr:MULTISPECIES: hypothetical protein [Clostridia]MCH1938343.1 hypothetical protein [Enterocloster sp. OA11]